MTVSINGTNGITYPVGSTQSVGATATGLYPLSGTYVDITGIPTGVKKISVNFSGVSLSGTANLLVQLGSGTIVTSGYTSISTFAGTGAATGAGVNNGLVVLSGNASNLFFGTMMLTLIGTNTFAESHSLGFGQGASFFVSVGGGTTPAFGSAVDRVRITSSNGTDTFDSGLVNILYE